MPQPVTLVTGASRGIGAAIAADLADRGHHVIGLSRSKPAAFKGEFIAVDLGDAVATNAALADITRRYKVTRLVNNAGVALVSELSKTSSDDYDMMMNLNVRAPVLAIQAVLPGMREAKFGRIVNIGSRAALGKETRAVYGATKAAILALTRTIALENAKFGITANCIAPGPVATEMLIANYPAGSPQQAAFLKQIPVGRIGTAAEIAHAAAYFLDGHAWYTTGQVLYVCGGMSIGQVPI
ncbi:MAG: SDR family oxidoreductase [Hyphomicrobiaceae bacterium]